MDPVCFKHVQTLVLGAQTEVLRRLKDPIIVLPVCPVLRPISLSNKSGSRHVDQIHPDPLVEIA